MIKTDCCLTSYGDSFIHSGVINLHWELTAVESNGCLSCWTNLMSSEFLYIRIFVYLNFCMPEFLYIWIFADLNFCRSEFLLIWVFVHLNFYISEFLYIWILVHLNFCMHELPCRSWVDFFNHSVLQTGPFSCHGSTFLIFSHKSTHLHKRKNIDVKCEWILYIIQYMPFQQEGIIFQTFLN